VVGRLKRFATTSRLKRAAMRVRRGLGAEVGDVRVCGRGGGAGRGGVLSRRVLQVVVYMQAGDINTVCTAVHGSR
jgi:hypothetical protein